MPDAAASGVDVRRRRRRPHHELGLEDHPLAIEALAELRLFQEQVDRGVADQGGGLADRRERHDGGRREVDVVVADERDLVGDPHRSLHHERLQHAHREQVVRGEHRVGPLVCGAFADDLAGRASLSTVSESVSMTSSDMPGVAATARRAPSRRSATWRMLDGPPTNAIAPPTGLGEMAHRQLAAHDVVDRDRREAAVGGLPVDEHDRGASGAQVLEARHVVGERGDQHAVHALLLEEVDVRPFAIVVLVAVAEQDRHAGFGGTIFGPAGDVGEEGVAHVEHDEADRAASSCAQLACRVVAHEAELVDRGLHAFDRGGGDLVGPVQHVRHGADRHGCRGRHISHAHGHLPIPPLGFVPPRRGIAVMSDRRARRSIPESIHGVPYATRPVT